MLPLHAWQAKKSAGGKLKIAKGVGGCVGGG